MWAPGAIGLVMGVLVLFLCKDSPESMGYPPIESIEKAKQVRMFEGRLSHGCTIAIGDGRPAVRVAREGTAAGTRRHLAASVWGKSDFHSIVGTPASTAWSNAHTGAASSFSCPRMPASQMTACK